MKELLQPFVRRGGRPYLHSGDACQVHSGLLPELAEALRRAFESGARGRAGVDQETHHEADDDRFHSRLEQAHPCAGTKGEVDEADAHGHATHDEDGCEKAERDQEWHEPELLCVDSRDNEERDDVVDDDDRQDERPQTVGKARPDEREQAEREGDVGDIAIPQPCADGRPALKAR